MVYSWEEKLRDGKKGEDDFVQFINTHSEFYAQRMGESFDKRGIDITLCRSDRDVTWQVKKDDKAMETGNLFIELLSDVCAGTLSWLYTTEAEMIGFLVGDTLYAGKVRKLRNFCFDYLRSDAKACYRDCHSNRDGKRWRTMGFTLNLSFLLEKKILKKLSLTVNAEEEVRAFFGE